MPDLPDYRMSPVMVLAAGRGARMGELTRDLPKPLLGVCGKPLLEHIFDHLERAGFRNVIVNSHYCAEVLHRYIERIRRAYTFTLHISHEPVLLETGGALSHARGLIDRLSGRVFLAPNFVDRPFFVVNGDLFWKTHFQSQNVSFPHSHAGDSESHASAGEPAGLSEIVLRGKKNCNNADVDQEKNAADSGTPYSDRLKGTFELERGSCQRDLRKSSPFPDDPVLACKDSQALSRPFSSIFEELYQIWLGHAQKHVAGLSRVAPDLERGISCGVLALIPQETAWGYRGPGDFMCDRASGRLYFLKKFLRDKESWPDKGTPRGQNPPRDQDSFSDLDLRSEKEENRVDNISNREGAQRLRKRGEDGDSAFAKGGDHHHAFLRSQGDEIRMTHTGESPAFQEGRNPIASDSLTGVTRYDCCAHAGHLGGKISESIAQADLENSQRPFALGPFVYGGLQILTCSTLTDSTLSPFSCRKIWDRLDARGAFYGHIWQDQWYHIGDKAALDAFSRLEGEM